MRKLASEGDSSVYALADRVVVASTPETRSICNDPLVYGLRYTQALRTACAQVLRLLNLSLEERETNVVHLLRGGLNFGLREALGEALRWNAHGCSFLSAQRRRTKADSEQWEIGENEYRKISLSGRVSLVLGDVVASGASLQYGLETMLEAVTEQGAELRDIVFFTIGGPRTEQVFAELDDSIRASHPAYRGTIIVYFEGRFPVAEPDTPLRVKITGTDLLRHGDALAPEFVESQYESPMFPVERCTIYDAGSRAFEPVCYLKDVLEYWETVETFHGVSFTDYLAERCPALDGARFQVSDLGELATRQAGRLKAELTRLGG